MTINDYLDRIIGWKEEKIVAIPIKKIPNKVKPIFEPEYKQTLKKRIIIKARVTSSNLAELYNLEKNLECKTLKNPINNKKCSVWIEKMKVTWRGNEDYNHPWLITINLLYGESISGEQITNGGFETGDFTGWTVTKGSNMIAVQKKDDYWSFIDAYEGTYYCGSKTNGDYGTIEQVLAEEVPVESVSKFEIHVLGGYDYSPPSGGKVTVEIVYTDDTTTSVSWEATNENKNTWQTLDLKTYLESGKTIKKLIIKINHDSVTYAMVDGCTCTV